MSSARDQLRAMLGLRWQMVRGRGLRMAIVAGVAALLWLIYVTVGSAASLDVPTLATALELAPAAYLGFGALAVVAPLSAGGGHEVVPPNQLVAYPVRPATLFLGGLLLAPLNLVWVTQLLVLTFLTACLTLDGSLLRGAVTTAGYVACLTVLGQTLAWLVVGLRQTRAGRRLIAGTGALLLLLAVLLVQAGGIGSSLQASPIRSVVAAVGTQDFAAWAAPTAILFALAGAGLLAGAAVCTWALRLPSDARIARYTAPVRRRAESRSAFRQLITTDRASVWRAPALRRGGLVLAVLPGLIAAGAAVPWESMIVLPGLVAAGAGLLFGVNAFCLDGSGALWLASLPHDPSSAARAKTVVLTETVLAAVVVAALAGSLRSPGTPTGSQLCAIIASGLACTAVVVAQCMRSSVRRPHRADLNGPRDAVAPPGALAVASARLALPAAGVGLWLAAAATTDLWWLPIAFALPIVLWAGLSLWRSLRRYADPGIRARVVQVVATG